VTNIQEKSMRLGRIVFASLMCLPLAACIDDEDIETEELGTTESALCSDGAANAIVAFDDAGGFSGAKSAQPTNAYDHPDCSDRYTVEVTGVSSATQPYSVRGGWGESLPTTESSCTLAFANVQTHEYRMSFQCSGQLCYPVWGWHQVGGDITVHGEWKPGFGGNYDCVMVPNSPLPVLQPTALRSKVRVAVRAYAWALFFPAYKRGEAGVYSMPIIP
jgi:hypothetical protein